MKWDIKFPALVFYVAKIKDDFAGKTNAFVVRIKETYKDDKGLLAHEIVHVKQWFLTLGLHSLLYRFSKSYRYLAEIKAYRKQLTYVQGNEKSDVALIFAKFISTRYNLNVTKEEAFKDLIK